MADDACIPWEIDTGCCTEWCDYPIELRARAEQLAWATIRTLTGGQVGSCPVVMRPCLSAPCEMCLGNWWSSPQVVNGEWFNNACGTPRCSCARVSEIDLGTTVADLIAVELDGETLPLSMFRIDNGRLLVREDGGCWPSCQNMGAPLGDVGTFGIAFIPGVRPGPAGLWAAGVLACEFAKACTGGKCKLPTAVTSIARQGVAFAMPSSMFENGMTGIQTVDAWLTSVNPHALRTPSTVWSPDFPRHRYTTWAGA